MRQTITVAAAALAATFMFGGVAQAAQSAEATGAVYVRSGPSTS